MMKKAIHALHVLVAVCFLPCMKTLSFGSEQLSKYDNHIRCIEREREALLVFKQEVANEYDHLQSWKKEKKDCCEWKGVGCDNRTGHVTHLYLSSLILPSYYIYTTNAHISIGNSLLDLKYLNYLDLSSNILAGIPEFIGSLTKLAYLDFSDTWIGISESSNTWIRGSIPEQIGNLSKLAYLDFPDTYIGVSVISDTWIGGSIPEKIGNLSKLQYLNLSGFFSTGPIPKFIGSLNNLRYLDLSNSCFTGVVPHELENLSNLLHLDLSNNPLTSSGNFGWLFNLSSLTHLSLSEIHFTPPSIWISFIQRIPSISFLRLEGCYLSSSSSTLSNFSSSISSLYLRDNIINSSIFHWLSHSTVSLKVLDLHNNMLEGVIPQSFAQLTDLTHLNLGHNLLSGSIANTFALMTALTNLDLSANQLSGELPKLIYNLSSLQIADFSSNNFTGNLEDLLSGHFALLQELSLYKNQLTGSVPDITLLSSLREVHVNSNQLNGCLPAVFKHHSVLQVLNLSDNHLRGCLPDFTRFSSLWFLDLSNNALSGSLPDFTGSSALQVLRLGKNQLTEWETRSTGLLSSLQELDLSMNSISSTISEAHLFNISSLEYMRTSFNSLTFEFSSDWLPPFQLLELSVPSCKLGPKFPNWIRNQQQIYHLDISNNQVEDTIPIWFGNLSSGMELLNLSSNKIRGKFPFNFVDIEVIDLSSNYFNGPLPPIPAACSKINLSQNKFSGTLLSFSAVKYFALSFLDISHNKLFGALPDNWIHYQILAFLNLGYNTFSGKIPMSIGQLGFLQTLILRNNKLHGELPASLGNCRDLGFVDFGFNKLSGTIPSWIGKDLLKLYALILKSNNFNGSLPYGICYLRNLHFLDVSINRISGTIPPCFGNLTAMTQKGNEVGKHDYFTNSSISSNVTTDYYVDSVLARWKGQEFEYGRNFAYLKMVDLSTNELMGEIPIGITRLVELKGLNLSSNRLYGKVPLEIGQLKGLECLDLSRNNFSGKIPSSMSGLNFLGYLDLSNNNLSGKIPSGTQLQGFSISAYQGNTELCGKPLTNICPEDEPANHVWPSSGYHAVDEDDSEYEKWLLISAVLGFSTTFWGFIGSLVLNRRWRHAYFLFLENLKEQFYVVMAVHIARLQRTV